MNNLRKDVVAILGSLILVATAFALLGYGRKNEVSTILFFGYFLDAFATTGIVGNLIVFLLAKLTRLNSIRTAVLTFVIVHLILLAPAVLLGKVNVLNVVVGYTVSCAFWIGIHWMWSRTLSVSTTSVAAE